MPKLSLSMLCFLVKESRYRLKYIQVPNGSKTHSDLLLNYSTSCPLKKLPADHILVLVPMVMHISRYICALHFCWGKCTDYGLTQSDLTMCMFQPMAGACKHKNIATRPLPPKRQQRAIFRLKEKP